MRPKPVSVLKPDGPWYECVPIGKEKLRTMVRDMCAEAGITEKKTNHSLRATGASHMFSASVPEKLIQSRTGHRSLEALRLYERPSHEQQQAVSNVLTSGAEAREFGKELTNVTAPNVQPITKTLQYRHQSQHATGGGFSTIPAFPGPLFGSMTNCLLTIGPQNFVVNINPVPTQRNADLVEQEFDELVQDLQY